MKYLFFLFTFIAIANCIYAQKRDTIQKRRVFTGSGVGYGLTFGNTRNVITPKITTKLGLDYAIGHKGFFLYPSLYLLVFKYNQKEFDPTYSYLIKKGRTTLSTFIFSLGYRKKIGKLNIYKYAGVGGTWIQEPRMKVDYLNQKAIMHINNSYSMCLGIGVGADYAIGQFSVFAEGGHLYNLKKLQGQSIFIFPLYVGLKSNISNLFKKL